MKQAARISAGVMTVAGPINPLDLGVTDAHQHAWIAPIEGAPAGGPLLCDLVEIIAGLASYREVGGLSLLDCQPGGCGRDGLILAELSRTTGVQIVACTGFHLARYYRADHWLWRATAERAHAYFVDEITAGLAETREADRPVRPGFVKIACTAQADDPPAALIEAAAHASRETGVALLVHTDAGARAEQTVAEILAYGVAVDRLVLCHIDKRPDFGLHRELAQAGFLLEYDTFFRAKYDPERNLWPLLQRMVAAGLSGHIAIGTDMADLNMWRKPGPTGMMTQIVPRLQAFGFTPATIQRLIGRNIADRLAGAELTHG